MQAFAWNPLHGTSNYIIFGAALLLLTVIAVCTAKNLSFFYRSERELPLVNNIASNPL